MSGLCAPVCISAKVVDAAACEILPVLHFSTLSTSEVHELSTRVLSIPSLHSLLREEMVTIAIPIDTNATALEGPDSSLSIAIKLVFESTSAWLPCRAILYPMCFVVVAWLYSHVMSCKCLPSSLPWIGKDSSKWFAETRAHFASFTNVRQWLAEGYLKVRSQCCSV